METIRVSVALEKDLVSRADVLAEVDGQTRSGLLREAVKRYVDERETWLKLEKDAEAALKDLASLPDPWESLKGG